MQLLSHPSYLSVQLLSHPSYLSVQLLSHPSYLSVQLLSHASYLGAQLRESGAELTAYCRAFGQERCLESLPVQLVNFSQLGLICKIHGVEPIHELAGNIIAELLVELAREFCCNGHPVLHVEIEFSQMIDTLGRDITAMAEQSSHFGRTRLA